MEKQDREIALIISLPLFYQYRVRGSIGHTSRAHLKGTLHQESRVKNKDLILEIYSFRKNA